MYPLGLLSSLLGFFVLLINVFRAVLGVLMWAFDVLVGVEVVFLFYCGCFWFGCGWLGWLLRVWSVVVLMF